MELENIFNMYDADSYSAVEVEDGLSDLAHIGVKFRSGRYPYGSGDRPKQHDPEGFLYDDGTIDYKTLSKFSEQSLNAWKDAQSSVSTFDKYFNPENKPLPKKDYLPQARKMSDEELRARINRLQMEQNYNRMMQEMNPSKRSISQQRLIKGLKTAGTIAGVGIAGATLFDKIVQTKKMLEHDKKMKAIKIKEAEWINEILKNDDFNNPAKTAVQKAAITGAVRKLVSFFDDYGEFID